MEDEDQVAAYAGADFDEPHSHFIQLFKDCFASRTVAGSVLDLGCGPGDISFRFAMACPVCTVEGVDGAENMVHYARQRLNADSSLNGRLEFTLGFLPDVELKQSDYDILISNSLLHHLPDPGVLWKTIKRYAAKGAMVFVMDLLRPDSVQQARLFVETYAANEKQILQRDFYNSLLAAFSLDEVKAQLRHEGLGHLQCKQISDRHFIVFGEL